MLFFNGPFSRIFFITPSLFIFITLILSRFPLSIFSMELAIITEATIQHVNRKSSDELLRKFADPDVEEPKSSKRQRKSTTNSKENFVESETNNFGLVEKKRLLLGPASKRRSLLLRQLASGKSNLRNKSLVRSIGKTWRKTMEGASRVFIEKHYNRHRRLISNDVV